MTKDETLSPLDAARRRFLAVSAAAGFAGTLLPGALMALASQASAQVQDLKDSAVSSPPITVEMIEQAAVIAGLSFTEAQRKVMVDGLVAQRDDVLEIRKLKLPNSVAPSMIFDPVPGGAVLHTERLPMRLGSAPSVAGLSLSEEETICFASVRQLGELLKTRKITSVALTKMYLARLKRLDSKLHCVITLTEERAIKHAVQADAEIASGHYKGPLHGVPWGAKDLLAVAGYPTTWGAAGFENQHFDEDAEVVKRLDAAGAVLIAKLSMGALAQGDLWGSDAHGARTRNPWNTRQGSSGSSAGSASATAAGCVGFAIGTETLGSISSPSTRCGATGVRPSFGLVPRTGAMALSWSMDKIGPITRSVEDCAIVLHAIYGPDGRDLACKPAAFNPDFMMDIQRLRIGYIKSAFDPPEMPESKASDTQKQGAARMAGYQRQLYDARFAIKALSVLRGMGITLQPVELPAVAFQPIVRMLEAEGAAAFDELTLSGRDALLIGQSSGDWPNTFRLARMYSAVDYIQAARARTLALAAMTEFFANFDVIVTPSGGTQLTATNLCGQPAVILPNGLRGDDAPPAPEAPNGAPNVSGGPGTPVSLTFLAPLYQEDKALAVAAAYQKKTGFHLLHPKL